MLLMCNSTKSLPFRDECTQNAEHSIHHIRKVISARKNENHYTHVTTRIQIARLEDLREIASLMA